MIDAVYYSEEVKKQQKAQTDVTTELVTRIIDVCERNPWLRGGREASQHDYRYGFSWQTLDQLKESFRHGNWALRVGFCHRIDDDHDLIFVQQVNGGDEWLTLKHSGAAIFPFESISWGLILGRDGEAEFDDIMARLIAASDDDLKRLNY
jgi:hypothetical protein